MALADKRDHDSVCAAAVDVSVDSQRSACPVSRPEDPVILFRKTVGHVTIDDRVRDSHRKLPSQYLDSVEMNPRLQPERTRRAGVVDHDDNRLAPDSCSSCARGSPERGS